MLQKKANTDFVNLQHAKVCPGIPPRVSKVRPNVAKIIGRDRMSLDQRGPRELQYPISVKSFALYVWALAYLPRRGWFLDIRSYNVWERESEKWAEEMVLK